MHDGGQFVLEGVLYNILTCISFLCRSMLCAVRLMILFSALESNFSLVHLIYFSTVQLICIFKLVEEMDNVARMLCVVQDSMKGCLCRKII